MVETLEAYPWSSYPAYINESSVPNWLHREKVYQMLGQKQRYKGYRDYVEKGIDEDIMQHLYELHTDDQREIVYNLCSNLYRAQHALELMLVNKGVSINGKPYNPESFESVR